MVAISGLAACQVAPVSSDSGSAAQAVVQPQPEAVKPEDLVTLQEKALSSAVQMYDNGRYEAAIAALTPLSTSVDLPLVSRVRALKYIAFSHCVEGRRKLCRQHFSMALELDPGFQLTEAERGHPIWGREFNSARNSGRTKRPAPSRKSS